MTDETKLVVEQNPHDGTWEIGWRMDAGEFVPGERGYATREEAEAAIPGFDERMEREFDAWFAEEQEENKQWPNVGRVRAEIKSLNDSGKPENLVKAVDASDKLNQLLNMDLVAYVRWPLPSWEAILSGRPYRK